MTPAATVTLTVPDNTPTVTPTAVKEPWFLKITDPVVYPCPYNPDSGTDLKIKIKLNKACGTITLKMYTAGYRRVFEKSYSGSFNGNTQFTAAANNFKRLSNGMYYYMITGKTSENQTATSKIESMIIIK